ncbi:uncharacterized protein LOC114405042 [Glycine soja]|uniref:uncharacterized protein LOC114405042 n=1 Tax=Glycine soja TaxID=3848 RepID=UPI00103DF62A|nr:uncharacterized protein LOC114405042 [Glycine soja]
MAGRNDCAIADALQALAHAIGNPNRGEASGAVEYQGLDRFQRNNPPSFNGALNWIREIEKIFRVMACPKGQKVAFGAYSLVEEAEYWWENTRQCLEAEGQDVTWDVFKRVFLEKYFPEDVRNKKEMEFLELKQGSMTVAEYVAKFEELQAVNYQGVRQFLLLVNMCQIWDEDSRDMVTYYRSTGPMRNKKNGPQHRGKPYSTPPKQYGNRHDNQRTAARGFAGGSGSKPNTFPTHIICYRCRKPGNISSHCPDNDMICFNCGQKGHTQRDCSRLKKEQNGGGHGKSLYP